jgi:parvulin-like peptidyl-prolyl isomerase
MLKNKNELKTKLDSIKKDIQDKSFQSAATIHGITGTASNGGLIGWVKKSSLNPLIQDKISDTGIGKYHGTNNYSWRYFDFKN